MCTFCSDLPVNQYGGNRRKAPITLYLKPNDPNNESEKYRFRVLNFRATGKNDRVYPFISRYVHNHWGVNDNGKRVVDDVVVCPSSPFVDAKHDESLGFTDIYRELKLRDKKPTWDCICPVCKHIAEAWNAWKSSGRTDRLALERIQSMKRQFQGVVPVYVVNDPVNEKNNGKFMCVVFSNQDEYKQFIDIVNRERAKIAAAGNSYGWCNGTNAVDFYLRMEKVPVVWNAGKPNEKQGTARRITKMAFGAKAYDLIDANGNEIVTKEAIDAFEFDEQYYVKNTKSDIEDFYKKHYSVVSKNIPQDEDDVFSAPASEVKPVQAQRPVAPTNPVKAPSDEIPVDAIDKVIQEADANASPDAVQIPADKPTDDSDKTVDELIDSIPFD